MIETLLISGGIIAATAIGTKLGLLKRDADRQADEWNAVAPTYAKVFRAQAELDSIAERTRTQLHQAELGGGS